jgi:hypothetical protein
MDVRTVLPTFVQTPSRSVRIASIRTALELIKANPPRDGGAKLEVSRE